MTLRRTELAFNLIDGVSRTLRTIGGNLGSLNQQFANLNQSVEFVGKGFKAISTGFGLGPAIVEAGALEDVLARVVDITRATAEEQEALQVAVQDGVGATRSSAEEAAGALALLAEDGLSATEAARELGTVLAFAQANAQSAAQAAQGLGAVLDTFQAPASEIGTLADALTSVARASGTSTKALQEGLAASGVAAQQAGLQFNVTTAALGALAKAGIDGTLGGRQLTKILQEISDPASAAGEALKGLGLEGAAFGDVIKRLSTDSAAAESVLAALGDRPRAALRALLADGGASLSELNQIINQSAGASKTAADALNDTFAGALDRVVNAFNLAKQTFLQPLLPVLAAELNTLAADFANFSKTAKFKELRVEFVQFFQEGIEGLKSFANSFDFTAASGKLGAFVDGAGASLSVLGKALGFVSDRIQQLGAGAAAPFNLLDLAWEGSKAVAQSAGQGIIEAARLVADENQALADASVRLGSAASESYGLAGAAAEGLGENIKTFIVGPTDEAAAATRKLKDEQAALRLVFASVVQGAEQYALALQRAGLLLADSVGLSAERIENVKTALKGISEEATFAALNTRAEFLRIAESADSTGAQISEAFRNAIKAATSKPELDQLQIEFNKLELAGKLSFKELAAANEDLGFKLRDLARAAIPELEKQFELLGITSQNALDKSAAAAAEAFDQIVLGAREGTAAAADVGRAFEAFARKQLAAVEGADAFKRAQVEAMLRSKAETLGVVDALETLGLAGEEATQKLAKGADQATESLSRTRDVTQDTADAATDLGTASNGTAGSITQVASAAASATGTLGGMSQALIDASNQLVAYGGGAEQQVILFNEAARGAEEYRQSLQRQIRELDPFEQEIDNLAQRFVGLDRASLEAIARLKQRAEGLREQIKKTQETIQVSSSVGGGNSQGGAAGNAQGNASGNPQGNAGGSGPGREAGSIGPAGGGSSFGGGAVTLNFVADEVLFKALESNPERSARIIWPAFQRIRAGAL